MITVRAPFHSRLAAAAAALAAVGVTALFIASGVRTDERATPAPSVKLAYAGPDLSPPHGAPQLYHRLQWASSTLCGWLDQVDVAGYVRWRDCSLDVAAGGAAGECAATAGALSQQCACVHSRLACS